VTTVEQSVVRNERGAAYVEYLALLTLVTLVGAGAVAALGIPLLRLYRFAEVILLLPSP
jgi:Flp pilus assembly pilin Flp